MSERTGIDLQQLASFLKKVSKKRKAKKAKRKKGLIETRQESATRQSMIDKLGIKQNVTDAKVETSYDKLKKRAEGGSLSLIYALQKDVKDIQNRFMGGSVQPQERPRGVGRVAQQTGFQDKNASFDSAIQAQRVATENKKNQDRIEKEAKAELKRIEAESKAEVKRIEKEVKAEQKRARKEQNELEDRIEQQEYEEKQNRKQQIVRERIDKARDDKERAKEAKELKEQQGVLGTSAKKKQSTITNYTIAQGMRTFTDFAPNPPDIGGGGGLPPLPFNRQRDQYDPLEPAPFYRSIADRIEAPVLQEVLDAMTRLPQGEDAVEGITMTQEELPQEELPLEVPDMDSSMTDEALLGLSTGMTESPQSPPDESALLGGGAVSPKKRGRPAGSKNKAKPVASDPSQVAMIGSSALVRRTPSGKTPANTPVGSMI